MDLDLETFVKQIEGIPVPIIDTNRRYWLVRTQSGEYYEEFFHDNFVGIGWDDLDFNEITKHEYNESLLELIKIKYPDEKQPGRILSQLKRFSLEIKINDIVLIPSAASNFLSFGVVETDVYEAEINDEDILDGACPFQKRRTVRWIKTVRKNEIDPYLYKLLNSHHTITDATAYDTFIDRTLHSLYVKGNETHLVLEVKKKDNIPYLGLIKLLNTPVELLPIVEEFTQEEIKEENLDIKLSLQSPGTIEIIYYTSPLVLIGLGLVLHYIVGGSYKGNYSKTESEQSVSIESTSDGLLEKWLKFRKQSDNQQMKLLEMQKVLSKLEVTTPKELKNLPVSEELPKGQ
ncbi:restriction endonuclease [Paenibacillus farraposensis]|uniref:Restriction endonuclease n=1 Tax=Paenibacillus farraposensis TaxID=2807095 RepID=A0ABW4DDW4_9BACL|nr:hypothetical protein [Paenibacillus farraposensis]MCC3380674.1 hypothetical protein [Paenibacillus farraposensis]